MVVFKPKRDADSPARIEWEPVPIEAGLGVALDDGWPLTMPLGAAPTLRAQFLTTERPGGTVWALMLTAPESTVAVNGLRALPVTRLHDRDEIALGTADTARLYFSTERTLEVVPFPGSERPTHCARSKARIEKGMPSVQCTCGL